MLRDSKTFTLRKDDGNVAGLRWWMPGVVRTIADNMLTTDEPDHTRLRSIVDEVFPRRAVLEMQPRIMVLANELADTLFADGSPPTFRSLCAKTAAFRDLRPSQAAARRPAQVRCLGKHLHALQQRPRLSRRHTDALHHEHYMQERLDAAHKDGGAGVIAELVRIEGKCALQALFERWPKLSLATDDSNLRWRTRTGIRALEQLPVAAGS